MCLFLSYLGTHISRGRPIAALRRFVDYLIAKDVLDAAHDIDVGKAESELRSLRSRRGPPLYQRPQVPAQLARLITYYDELEPPDPDQPDTARLHLELLRNRAFMHTLYATGGRVSTAGGMKPR